MFHRKNNVVRTLNGAPAFAASYTVTTYPIGARVASASSGTTITVDAPHGFAAGDKLLINPASDNTFSGTDTVQSTTGTTVVMGQSYSVSVGDIIVNLGPDTGTSAPNYDGSPVPTYSDPDFGTANTNSRVTCDAEGDYTYYYKGDGLAWELIRDSSGVVVGHIAGFGGLDRYSVADFGAAIDGTTDDNARIQAAITAAGAGVTAAAGSTQYAIGGKVVYLPPGETAIDSALEIESDTVHLVGAGKGISNIVNTGGTRSITVGDGTNRIFNVRLADFTVSYDDQHHSGVMPGANTIAVLIQEPRKFEMENVVVYFDEENEVAGLTGIKTVGMEPGTLKNCEVHNCYGTTTGNNAVAFHIDGGAANRGNVHIDTCFARHAQVGFKLEDSSANIYNSTTFTNCKVVNISSAQSRDPKYGFHITDNTIFGVTLIEPHVEGESGDPFEIGYFFDNCTGVVCLNPMLSQCTVGFDMDSVDGAQILNPYFLVGTFTEGFNLDSSCTNVEIKGARRRGVVTVTTWLTDAGNESATNHLFHWKANTDAADLQNWHLTGRAEIGDLQSVTADSGADELVVGADGANSGITIVTDNNQSGNLNFADTDSATAGGLQFDHTNDRINFRIGGTTRWFINSSGFLVGNGNNSSAVSIKYVTEDITINGATVDSTATLLPANSLILGVLARVTTGFDTGTDFDIGDDSPNTDRFSIDNAVAVDTTVTGLDHWTAGEVEEISGQKIRITTTGSAPSSGVVRVTVFYIDFTGLAA